jgi:hypothetical protein
MEAKSKEKSWKEKISGLIFEEDGSEENREYPLPQLEEKRPAIGTQKVIEETSPMMETITAANADRKSTSPADANIAINTTEIYRSAGIVQDSFSTPEQVMELQSTFSDLPLELQKQKVLKTLASFKVNIDNVIENTRSKITAMERYLKGIQAEAQSTIDTSGQTIVQLQMQMDECRQRIAQAQSLMNQTTGQCRQETDRLQSVLDFLGVSFPKSRESIEDQRK